MIYFWPTVYLFLMFFPSIINCSVIPDFFKGVRSREVKDWLAVSTLHPRKDASWEYSPWSSSNSSVLGFSFISHLLQIFLPGIKVAKSNKRKSYFLILSNVCYFSVLFTGLVWMLKGSLQVFCKAVDLSNRVFVMVPWHRYMVTFHPYKICSKNEFFSLQLF